MLPQNCGILRIYPICAKYDFISSSMKQKMKTDTRKNQAKWVVADVTLLKSIATKKSLIFHFTSFLRQIYAPT